MILHFLISLSLSQEPQTQTIDDLIFNIYSNNTASVIGYKKDAVFENLVIPNTILGSIHSVISIGNEAFSQAPISGTLTLPSTLEYIYSFAFHKTAIKSINFGSLSELLEIGEQAFSLCSKLNCQIALPDSLVSIGVGAFANTIINGEIDGSKLQNIGAYAFQGTEITKFTFPDNIQVIPKFLFSFSELQGTVRIPNYVTEIESHAFHSTKITSINFPDVLKKIRDGAFSFCAQFAVTMPSTTPFELIGSESFAFTKVSFAGVLNCGIIGENAFRQCKEISGDVIVNCGFIGKGAFAQCLNIETADLRYIVKDGNFVSNTLFAYCSCLKRVQISNSQGYSLVIEEGAFYMCTSLVDVALPFERVTSIGSLAFCFCSKYRGSVDLSVYANLINIKSKAFFGCDSLFGELKLPENLHEIGDYAFAGCPISGSVVIPD